MLSAHPAACLPGPPTTHTTQHPTHLSRVKLLANAAFYGGGMFVAANMTTRATLSMLNLTDNRAVVGPAAYW